MTALPADLPENVTRFYGTVDFALDVLKNRQIAFVHVTMLNDPFDPYGFYETDFGDSYPGLIRYVKEKHPQDLSWFRTCVTPVSWGNTVRGVKASLARLKANTFMLSTSAAKDGSEPKDNLYMWGHYGNGHRGLAIEFDTRALAGAALAQHEAENGKPSEDQNVWAKVEYARTFAPISAEDVFRFLKQEMEIHRGRQKERAVTQLDRYYSRMSIIKSDVWQSENEWRLMWRSTEDRKIYKCPIDQDAITAIYLGISLPADRADEAIAAAHANFPNASVLKAQKRHGDLALDFRAV
jgi:hypothetical protein